MNIGQHWCDCGDLKLQGGKAALTNQDNSLSSFVFHLDQEIMVNLSVMLRDCSYTFYGAESELISRLIKYMIIIWLTTS